MLIQPRRGLRALRMTLWPATRAPRRWKDHAGETSAECDDSAPGGRLFAAGLLQSNQKVGSWRSKETQLVQPAVCFLQFSLSKERAKALIQHRGFHGVLKQTQFP